MIQRKPPARARAVIAEKPAGAVAHKNITALGGLQVGCGKHLPAAKQPRAARRDLNFLQGDVRPPRVFQLQPGLALRAPLAGNGINQMAKRLHRRGRQAQKQPGGQPRRRPLVGLRLVAKGHGNVKHMGAETGVRAVSGLAVGVAKQRMQPAVQKRVRRVQVVKQFRVPVSGRKFPRAQIHGRLVPARQRAEFLAAELGAVRVAANHNHRNVFQRAGHRRGQALALIFGHRQNGCGQNKALPHHRRNPANFLVVRQVRALHIRMIDSPPPVLAHDLVARAHKPLSGVNLQLLRPFRLRQQFGDIHRAGAERRDFLPQPANVFVVAHPVQPHFARRNGSGVGVLHPEHNFFVRPRGWQPGVKIRRPGVGVVRAAEFGVGFAESVHHILDNVVPRAVDDGNEQLPGKFRQIKFLADLAGVQGHQGVCFAQRALKIGQNFAVSAEEPAPQERVLGAVSAPVVCGHHAGVPPFFIAKEGEVCGKVEVEKIVPLVSQQAVGDSHVVQGDHFTLVGNQPGNLRKRTIGIKRGNKKQVGARVRQRGDGRRLGPKNLAPDCKRILREEGLEVAGAQPVQGGERGQLPSGVVNCGGLCGADFGGNAGAGLGGQRMPQRLEVGEPAQAVAESFNRKRHCFSARDAGRRGFFSARRSGGAAGARGAGIFRRPPN